MVKMVKRQGYCRKCGKWGHWANTCVVGEKSYYSGSKKKYYKKSR